MKKVLFLFTFLLLLVMSSCKKSILQETVSKNELTENFKTAHLEGSYKGTFTRTSGALGNAATSNVTLSFANGKFTGTSSLNYYPALCSGSFVANGSELKVENACGFTANFDWTFIFNGTYQYSVQGNQLKIWRDYANGSRDLYVLQKE